MHAYTITKKGTTHHLSTTNILRVAYRLILPTAKKYEYVTAVYTPRSLLLLCCRLRIIYDDTIKMLLSC